MHVWRSYVYRGYTACYGIRGFEADYTALKFYNHTEGEGERERALREFGFSKPRTHLILSLSVSVSVGFFGDLFCRGEERGEVTRCTRALQTFSRFGIVSV